MDVREILKALVFFTVFFASFDIYSLYIARKMLTKWCHNHGYRVLEAKRDWHQYDPFGHYKALNVLLECYEGVQRGKARCYMSRNSSQNRVFVELLSWESQRNPR